MAEPERILIQSRWPIYSHNFIISKYLPMIFDTHSQETLIYMLIVFLFAELFFAFQRVVFSLIISSK